MAPALLLGLALTGCPSTAEPAYGVPATETDGGSETETGSDMGDMDATADATDADAGESEYGVASTGEEAGRAPGPSADPDTLTPEIPQD